MHSLLDILSSLPLYSWVALVISALGIAAMCMRALETNEARAKSAERKRRNELRSLAERISSYGHTVHQRYPTGDVVVSERDLAEQLRKPHNAVATALNLLLSEQKVQRAPLRRVLEIERVSAGYLCREIPENSVKGNGGNENCHRKNCCESDFNALMVRPFAEQIHIYSHGLKRKRPTPARVMGRFRLISPPPKTAQSQLNLASKLRE